MITSLRLCGNEEVEVDEAVVIGVIVALQSVLLVLIAARGGLHFDGMGVVVECDAGGPVRRVYAFLVSFVLLFLAIPMFQSGASLLRGSCVVEGALLSFAAVSDGEVDLKGLRFGHGGLNDVIRACVAVLGALLLYLGWKPTGLASLVFVLISGLAALVAIADKFEVLFLKLRSADGAAGPRLVLGAFSVVAMGVALFLAFGTEASTSPKSLLSTTVAASSVGTQEWRWADYLHADHCPNPCFAGRACAGVGNTCPSGVTCLPGEGHEVLEASANWNLRLSAIHTQNGPLACSAGADVWVCFESLTRKKGEGEQCLSFRDACTSVGSAAPTVMVTTQDLINADAHLVIRRGSRNGKIVAERSAKSYGTLARNSVCRGGQIRLNSPDFSHIVYYLEPFRRE
jgi:hypothetical protein